VAAVNSQPNEYAEPDEDVVVVGAGMAGLYQVHRLRQAGFRVQGFEAADDVGGTWYWNRYPGARCDITTLDYCYSFDPELEQAWQWSEKYATQPEILAYLRFVADRYDLRRSFRFSTKVTRAAWDEEQHHWMVATDHGDQLTCRFLVLATGCLSVPKTWDVPGVERFGGETLVTGRWPHEGVDLAGKRVGVIGTGSSGIQCIPEIAKVAAQVVVFQRTPNFSAPAHHGPPPSERVAALAADRDAYREAARWSRGGVPVEPSMVFASQLSEEERRSHFERAWSEGELFSILNVFADQGTRLEANEVVAESIREQIRQQVEDPEVAEALSPRNHPFGTKRPCLDDGYYATYNLPHVRLVDLRRTPIETVDETGVRTSAEHVDLDVLVLATGFAIVALPVPWRALLFAYAVAQVAGAIAPVPGGIGFVEGGMIGALTLAGTPPGDAVVATVIYRLVTTLGMAGIGSLALIFVQHRPPTPARLTGAAAALVRRGTHPAHGDRTPREGAKAPTNSEREGAAAETGAEEEQEKEGTPDERRGEEERR
jgi:cation diffusion facilitator CzcD-associated flavoprotein CzcO